MSTRPISAELIRKAGRPAPATDSVLSGFLLTMAELFSSTFKELAAAPVRVESDGLFVASRDTPIVDGRVIRLGSTRGPLTPCLVADRTTILGLCEAAFGGTGSEPPFEGGDRPLSRTERRLRDALLTKLTGRIPEGLERNFGDPFPQIVEDERKPPSREVLSIPYVVGRYLVHIFGYSGELNLLLPEEEVAAILAGPRTTSGTPNTTSATDLYMQKLQQADVELVALLPPEWRPLGDVAGLKPGQLLGLGARAGGPVEIRAAGQMLYHAHMVPGGNGIRLEIVDREGSL